MESATATDQAKEQVQEKAQVAQEKAREGAQQAKSRVTDEVDRRSTEAGQQVSSTAQALRSTSETLRSEGKEKEAQAAEKAATQAEKLGSYLTDSNADRILSDLEDFGRRQPLAVVGAGLALGFAASRFLKASGRQRYQQRSSFQGQSNPGTYGQGYSAPTYSGARDTFATEPAGASGVGLTGGVGTGAERVRETTTPEPAGLGQSTGAVNPPAGR